MCGCVNMLAAGFGICVLSVDSVGCKIWVACDAAAGLYLFCGDVQLCRLLYVGSIDGWISKGIPVYHIGNWLLALFPCFFFFLHTSSFCIFFFFFLYANLFSS